MGKFATGPRQGEARRVVVPPRGGGSMGGRAKWTVASGAVRRGQAPTGSSRQSVPKNRLSVSAT